MNGLRPLILRRPATRTLVSMIVRRLPWTLLMVTAILLVTTVTGTIHRPITPAQLRVWGWGLDAMQHGQVIALLGAVFQANQPYVVLTITVSLLLFLGACEYLLGTWQAVLGFIVTHVVAYVGANLFLWPFVVTGYGWASDLTRSADVGASAAAFGVAGMALPSLPPYLRKAAFALLVAYLIGALMISQQIWDIEHLIAFPAGLFLGLRFLKQRGQPRPALAPRIGRRQRPLLAAWAVAVMGFTNVLSSFVADVDSGLLWLEAWLPLEIPNDSRSVSVLLGFALLILAFGLARAQHQAWLLTLVALVGSALAHLLKGIDLPEAISAALLLALLWYWRDAFRARTDPPALRKGYLALALLAILVPLYGIAGLSVLRGQYSQPYSPSGALRETAARLVFAQSGASVPLTRQAGWLLQSIPVVGWSALLYALTQLLRGALAVKPSLPDREQARLLLGAYGRGNTSYMTLWPGNHLFFGPEQGAYLSYRVAARVALGLGDPIGSAALCDATIAAFEQFCREHGWEPVFYGVGPDALPVYEHRGYRIIKVGEEGLIPLSNLAFRGRNWQDVRTALNRAEREGIRFQIYEGGTLPPAVREQIFSISTEWLRGKQLPEMEFTLGKVDDIDDPNVYVTVALDERGRVHAFANWLPMYAANGWVIDLMRRRSDAFGGVMEFLIASSLLAFKDQGAAVASLSAAPLADVERDGDESVIAHVLEVMYQRFDRLYHFQSLFAFKRKFQPQWQGVYLVYASQADLPRIALAVLRAHLPDLGPGRLAQMLDTAVARRLFPTGAASETVASDDAA